MRTYNFTYNNGISTPIEAADLEQAILFAKSVLRQAMELKVFSTIRIVFNGRTLMHVTSHKDESISTYN